MSKKKQRQESNPEPQELKVAEQDVLSFSFLQRNGTEIERPFSRDVLLMTTRVNGTSYIENIHELAASVKEGDLVQLLLEPDNPVDPCAILVRTMKGEKLGYIPMKRNEVLFHLMNAGKKLFGVIVGGKIGELTEADGAWVPIYIDVYMRD